MIIDDLGWKDIGYMGSNSMKHPQSTGWPNKGSYLPMLTAVRPTAYQNAPVCYVGHVSLDTEYIIVTSAGRKSENKRLLPIENNIKEDQAEINKAKPLKSAG